MTPHTPDRAAMQALQQAYAACCQPHGHRKGAPWTRDEMLQLGRLYLASHGVNPPSSRLLAIYCQPDYRAILTVFGTYAVYYAALEDTA